MDAEPGVRWHYKVDGRISKKSHLRTERDDGPGRGIKETMIGDFVFADDTGLVGRHDEMVEAQRNF